MLYRLTHFWERKRRYVISIAIAVVFPAGVVLAVHRHRQEIKKLVNKGREAKDKGKQLFLAYARGRDSRIER